MNKDLMTELSEYCMMSTGILFNDQISLNVNGLFPAKSAVEKEETYSATKKISISKRKQT